MNLLSIALLALVLITKPATAQQVYGGQYTSQLSSQLSSQFSSVYLEDLTWPEVRDFLERGGSTIVIPTGGTEQSGPHLALGKHNAIVHFTAGEIARGLGNALVAPVIKYVPEGRISPPEGHMRFPGTISVSESNFAGILEDAARSFKQHGFVNIVFLGDHRGSQPAMQRIAEELSHEWRTIPTQVIFASHYFSANGQAQWAAEEGIKGDITAHAGFGDTSELMATDARLVRPRLIKPYSAKDASSFGVAGDPSNAHAQYGTTLLNLKVNAAIQQIKGMAR